MNKRVTGKQRTANQLTGEVGQKIFAKWASLHRLSPTKPEEDYGIDSQCQVFRSNAKRGEILAGATVSVQVRSTSVNEGTQRVKVDRNDAAVALRNDGPYLLVGVDVPKERIYFRFLDEEFMEKLNPFLLGKKKSLSWPLENMESDEQVFFRQLDEVCRRVCPARPGRIINESLH